MAITPQQRALLDTISWAEGTWDSKANRPRYDITFGYQSADPSKPHPGRVVRSGGYASDATGAYQFLSPTWKGANGGVNAPMTPENQDRAALQLVRGRGVDPSRPLDAAALDRLAPEWASLPTAKGGSYYGQPSKNRQSLLDFYNQRLGAAPNPGNSNSAGAPPAASSSPSAAPAAAAAGGGGDDGSGAVLAALAASSNSNADVLSALAAGGNRNPASGLAALALSQQQGLQTMIDDLGSSLRPRAQAHSAELEATGQRRFANSPFFQQALSLLS